MYYRNSLPHWDLPTTETWAISEPLVYHGTVWMYYGTMVLCPKQRDQFSLGGMVRSYAIRVQSIMSRSQTLTDTHRHSQTLTDTHRSRSPKVCSVLYSPPLATAVLQKSQSSWIKRHRWSWSWSRCMWTHACCVTCCIAGLVAVTWWDFKYPRPVHRGLQLCNGLLHIRSTNVHTVYGSGTGLTQNRRTS